MTSRKYPAAAMMLARCHTWCPVRKMPVSATMLLSMRWGSVPNDTAEGNGREPTPMVNGHTHVYSGLVPLGMRAPGIPPASFVEILERVWWRLDRALDLKTLRAA